MGRRRSFHHRIIHALSAGLADLVPPERHLRVRALVVRQPQVFAAEPLVVPRIEADVALLVVNHPPADDHRGADDPYYDPAEVRRRLDDLFGPVAWAPIGPSIRAALGRTGADLPLHAEDWHNILDVDEWAVDRGRFVADRPVIGRHSRNAPTKWPDSRRDLLAAYPDDPAVLVRILGGADPALKLLGRLPANWTVHPWGALSPRRFLREIDVFVYYHHPGWTEAFGRNIIEALASGAPAVLPPHFEALFEDAALYAQPDRVREIVDGLYGDPGRYRARVAIGEEFADRRFGFRTHIERLTALIGPPSGDRLLPVRAPRARLRGLCVSAEPAGGGSAARLRRLAAALPADAEASFLLASPAFATLAGEAGLAEHVRMEDAPSAAADERLRRRLERTIARQGIDVVVVDGRRPPAGAVAAAREAAIPFAWLRPEEDGEVGGGEAFAAVLPVARGALVADPLAAPSGPAPEGGAPAPPP